MKNLVRSAALMLAGAAASHLIGSAAARADARPLFTIERQALWLGDAVMFEPGRLAVARWMRKCAFEDGRDPAVSYEAMEYHCGPDSALRDIEGK